MCPDNSKELEKPFMGREINGILQNFSFIFFAGIRLCAGF